MAGNRWMPQRTAGNPYVEKVSWGCESKKKENRWWFLFGASERRRQTAIAAANPDFSNLRLALPIPTWYQNCQWHRFDEREIKNCCLSSCSKSEDKIVNLLCPLYQWFNLGIELGKALQIALTVWETVKGWKCSLPSKCQNSLETVKAIFFCLTL